MSWLRALGASARSGLTVERKRLEPLLALRAALGLALVMAFGLWALGPIAAVSSAFGAFQAAIATFQRSWRPRPELALVSGASLAVSSFLGYLAHPYLGPFLALLGAWTFLAGLTWAIGPTIGLLATTNVAIMLITVTLPSSIGQAAVHAAMMVLGGLVQAALVVLLPVRRWGARRDALADALAAEADYARRLRHDPVAPFDPAPLMAAREAAAVTVRQARRRPADLRGPRPLAERIRPVLASLADPALGVPDTGPARDRVRELLAAAGAVLDATAHAVRRAEPVRAPAWAVAAFRTPDTGSLLTGPSRRAALRLGALLDRMADLAATAGADPPADRTASTGLVRPSLVALVPAAAAEVRRELRRRSPVLRHAVRVTAVTTAGYLAGSLLPLGHGYWAPLTSVMVMRPDFSETYARAVGRFGGTLLGVALATALVQSAAPGSLVLGAFAVLCAGLMYLLLRTGQFAAQTCLATYVVLLLGMAGEQWTQTVPERVVLTLVGGLLAMLSYALYPAWETPRLRFRLADWLTAVGRYAATVLARYAVPADEGAPRGAQPDGAPAGEPRPAHGEGPDGAAVRAALLKARTARAAWHDSVARAAAEPVRSRGLAPGRARAAERALGRFGRAAMLLEAHLTERGGTPVPGAAALAEALRRAVDEGARAVRERRVPDWRPVREALAADPSPPPPGDGDGDGHVDAVVRHGAGLLLAALEDLSRALDPGAPQDPEAPPDVGSGSLDPTT
ncbi:FUSC family protein [Streptomyces sp. NPDC049906]|uniref:FUSC family protein n=1 Tax=Streptomyces sp. NPDC049906 TaxID=3155656 RepID=UPI00343FE9E1